MKVAVPFLALLAVAACEAAPVSPEKAAEICEERARAAQGPTGNVTVGVNSNSGRYVSGEIGLTADYLRGRDPMVVYERCVIDLTGLDPIRPPYLR